MKVTQNGLIMEGTPEEIAQLMKLIETKATKGVPIQSHTIVMMSPSVEAVIRSQSTKGHL